MGQKLDEGLLLDLIEKRRAGKFTGDELLWAADHPEVIRWAMARPRIVAGIRRLFALPTEITVGGRVYEILSFLKGENKPVNGNTMVSRAKEMNANLGEEDGKRFLRHKADIPAMLRGKIAFVFPDWRFTDGNRGVACLFGGSSGWYQDWRWLSSDWDDYYRVLRRKSA